MTTTSDPRFAPYGGPAPADPAAAGRPSGDLTPVPAPIPVPVPRASAAPPVPPGPLGPAPWSGTAPTRGLPWAGPRTDYSSLAITGFVMSFLPLLSIPAIICCLIALGRTGHDRLRGRGLAVAGVALGCVGLVVWLGILAAVAIPVFLAQQQAAVGGP